MEFTTIISLISMIATVISTIFAFKAKNEALKTKNEIIQIRNDFSSVDTTSSIINHGTNSGVRAGTVNGGLVLMASNTGENRGVMADTINGPVTFIYDSREKKVPTLLPKLIAALAKMDFKQKKDFRKIEKNNAYTIEDKIDHNQVDSYEEVIRKVYPSPQYPPQGFSSGCSSLLNSLFIWSKLI